MPVNLNQALVGTERTDPLQALDGVSPGQFLAGLLPPGLLGGGVPSAQEITGSKRALNERGHRVSISNALHDLLTDSTRRLLNDFSK